MSTEIAHQDIENTVKNVKNSEEAMEVVKGMEKKYISNKYSLLPTNTFKFGRFKIEW